MTLQKRSSSVFTLALLLSVAGVPKASANRLPLLTSPLLAQSTTPFPLPPSVPPDTTVKIEGSTSMTIANNALKQKFEGQYAGSTVDVKYTGTDEGIQALLAGKADLAAIGRSLTDAEKAQGLVAIPVSRNKIAILVGEENAFQGSLTASQFAQIFRGEITDWSQVGGAPGAIRLVDRPISSDTRAALSRYPVFQNRPFESVASAVKLTDDTPATMLKELGADGISYGIANSSEYPGARIVPMHNVLPSDPRYPFSQPLAYVYRGAAASPAAAAFLGLATAPLGKEAISAAQAAIAATATTVPAATDPVATAPAATTPAATAPAATEPSVVPSATLSPDPSSVTSSPDAVVARTPDPATPVAALPPDTGLPSWLGWLLLPLLGLLLGWWLKRRRDSAYATTSTQPQEAVSVEPPPNTTDGAGLAERAGSVISADRVAINGVNHPTGSGVNDPTVADQPSVNMPAGEAPDGFGIEGGALGAAAAGAAAIAGLSAMSRRDSPLEANPWDETPIAETPVAEEFIVEESELEAPPASPEPDAYLAGATGIAGAAIAGAAITSRFTPSSQAPQPSTTIPDDAQSAVEAARFDVGQTDLTREDLAAVDADLSDLPDGYGESQIVLIPRDPHWAYAYWDVPQAHREEVRQQGGTRLALRLYDVTDIDSTVTNSHSVQQFECEEFARDWYLPVPVSDRDYRAEIGYLTADGTWLLLARSLPIRIPPVYPSDWVDDQDMTVAWDEDLKGRTFLELLSPRSRRAFQPIPTTYQLAQDAEAQRIAGSIFGSMQQIPPVSSVANQSGFGMSGVGMSGVGMSGVGMASGLSSLNLSGIGMSGIGMSAIETFPGMNMSGVGMSGIGMFPGANMSGIGMSGIGMSGIGMLGLGMSGIGMSGIGMMSGAGFVSAPPNRPRQFWLVADAELIVYGATEPNAKLTIGGQPIPLNPDGTFRIQLSFQDGVLDFPIMAVAADGEQNRSVHLTFKRETPSRNTNTKEEAQDEWGNWGI